MKQVSPGSLSGSAEGLGCMGMSSVYGTADWDESVATIQRAVELGVIHIGTADAYGTGRSTRSPPCRANIRCGPAIRRPSWPTWPRSTAWDWSPTARSAVAS